MAFECSEIGVPKVLLKEAVVDWIRIHSDSEISGLKISFYKKKREE